MCPFDHELDTEQLERLVRDLQRLGQRLDRPADWPAASLECCRAVQLPKAFIPREHGGWDWSDAEQLELLQQLTVGCLTTAFIYTQFIAAIRRLGRAPAVAERWLPNLSEGRQWTTVGISHLSTSRQHAPPALRATPTDRGWVLDGYAPWVTGGRYADLLVVGATLPDQDQILLAVEQNRPGITTGPGLELMALSASCTDRVTFDQVYVSSDLRVAGPTRQVLLEPASAGGGTGGLATSALALGLTRRAIAALDEEAALQQRQSLSHTVAHFRRRLGQANTELHAVCRATSTSTAAALRTEANRLVLDASQALLTATKGEGFRQDHLASRLAREAMFFLVWSCPLAVADAHLCNWADGPAMREA
jgi:alkylation response protein AidB-like acyl-CoA dehydrogenase